MTRLVVFDCDGTLIDSQAAICETMEEAFAAAALPAPPRRAVRRMVGLSLPQALTRLAPAASEAERARVLEAYKAGFFSRRSSGRLEEPLFDGLGDVLRRLHGDGWLLGVATGKSDRGLLACLDSHGIRDLFVTLQTADRHPSKPHPAMLEAALFEAGVTAQDAVMIGDTSFDVEMAQGAGAPAIGVDWGYHDTGELLRAGALGVARDAAELESMIRD